jgi:hypothetical protein
LSQAQSFFGDQPSDESPKRNAAAATPAAVVPGNFDQGSRSGLLPEIRNALNSAKLCTAFLERQLCAGRSDGELMEALKTIEGVIDRVSELATELANTTGNAPAPANDAPSGVRQSAAEHVTRGIRGVALAGGDDTGSELSDLEQCLNELVRAATQTVLNGGRVLLRARVVTTS